MKVTTNEKGDIVLKEVFSGVGLETAEGEQFGICMRDGAFEFNYGGTWYCARGGKIIPLGTKKENLWLSIDEYHK